MKAFEKKLVKYAAVLVCMILLGVGVWMAKTPRPPDSSPHSDSQHMSQASTREEAEVWTCSMHPQIRLPAPGKCPICAMDLIPVREEADHGAREPQSLREIRLTPHAERLAQIRTRPVERRSIHTHLRLVGRIDYDETRVANITAWVPGRIQRLFVDFTGTRVKKGDPMVSLYSPELLSTQEELLQAVRAHERTGQSALMQETTRSAVNAARERLRLWGLGAHQVNEIVRRGKPMEHVTIPAPMSGVVVGKDALEGMYVQTGARIYTLADLSRVWVRLEAYESDLAWIRKGQEVEFQAEAYPGKLFKGRVDFIDPFLNPVTRTAGVRLDADNPDGRLKPDMFVHASLQSALNQAGEALSPGAREEVPPLVIPASAPLITGKRAVVYVAVPDAPGTYEGREVVLGPRAQDHYVVRHGLQEGEMVVVHGNFKIDSAIQILAKPSMMSPEGTGGSMEHDHGPSPRLSTPEGEAPAMAPPAFLHQLSDLLSAYEEISQAVQAEDLGGIRREFSTLKRLLLNMDISPLSGHVRMVWLELAMLLGNDAVLGMEARSLAEAHRSFVVLTGHMERVRRELGVDHTVHEGRSPRLSDAVPMPFKAQLATFLDAYLVVHEDLAGDRYPEARENLKALEEALEAADMTLSEFSEAEPQEKWMPLSANLHAALQAAGKSEDIGSLRRSFLPISENLAAALEIFGILSSQPIHEIRCPMAFEGAGGTWLQKDTQVRNPYYGAMMLPCGDVIRSFPGESERVEEEHGHE